MSALEFEKKLLSVLKENSNRYLDEQALWRDFGLDQAENGGAENCRDIGRAVETLRLQGYGIDGDETRGWCLIQAPDILNYLEIDSSLTTSFLGRHLFAYRIIGSTNETARKLAAAGAPDGSLLVAEEQTSGKGRFENQWHSPPGVGIWASLILRPGIAPSQVGALGMMAALSICLAVEEQTALQPQIKWPNDLFLDRRKFGGILCETSISGGRTAYVILGFGINVNQEQFPPELERGATSLRMASGKGPLDRVALLRTVLDKLEDSYFKLLAEGFSFFVPRVQVRDFLRNRRVKLEVGGATLCGTARGIDENGALLLEPDNSDRLQQVVQGRVLEYE